MEWYNTEDSLVKCKVVRGNDAFDHWASGAELFKKTFEVQVADGPDETTEFGLYVDGEKDSKGDPLILWGFMAACCELDETDVVCGSAMAARGTILPWRSARWKMSCKPLATKKSRSLGNS